MAAVTFRPCPRQYVRDCEEIHHAWDEFGKNEEKLIQILARRNAIERKQIRETYAAMYGEDFLKRLQRELQGKIQKCMYLWMHDPADRDAVIARDAFENWSTKYRALTEIFCSRKSSEILLIKQAYFSKFKRNFDDDIASETAGSHQKILVALATAHRSHSKEVDIHIAKCDAKRLYEAREGRVGTDEATMIEILSKRSVPQLRATIVCYKQIYGHDITKAFNKETSGEFEDALRITVKCLYSPPKYFAKVLHTAIKGQSTDESVLTRVMVTRAEGDMEEIRKVYRERYQTTLEQAIKEETAGHYRSFLLALVTRAGSVA
eukprot:Gb_23923 [translate_table: standard]